MQALEPLAGEELERQLARYARVRLGPTPAQSRRARAAVMEAAWRRRLRPEGIAIAAPPARRTRRGPFAAWSGRRVGTSMAAAVLAGLMVGSAAFATTRAGGPLYEARLAFEAMTLPAAPGARLDAELVQAQTRLSELVDAVGRGDQGAIVAALGAYDRSLDDLAGATGGPADRALEAVAFHRAVLLGLLDRVPAQARDGLENALQRSGGVIDTLAAAGTGGNGPGGASNPGSGGTSNPGSGGENPNKPDRTPGPARTQPPEATPRPTKPPKTPNPNAARTPGPAASQDSDGRRGQP